MMRSRITAAASPSSRCLAAAASPWPLVLLRWRLVLDTPRLVFIQPADVESKSMAKRLASKLKGIAKDKFRLSFLDPVTGVCVPTGNDGLGYIITLPKEWLVKHGKHLRDGLMVVKLACAIGRIAGLPLPDMIGLPKEVVTKAEARAVKAFEELLDNAERAVEEGGGLSEESSAMSSGSGPPSRLSRAASSGYEAATGKAYRALQMLIDKQCGDKELLHCGLEKVKANDGTVEWVAPESKERFVKEGAACLIWNQQELS